MSNMIFPQHIEEMPLRCPSPGKIRKQSALSCCFCLTTIVNVQGLDPSGPRATHSGCTPLPNGGSGMLLVLMAAGCWRGAPRKPTVWQESAYRMALAQLLGAFSRFSCALGRACLP